MKTDRAIELLKQMIAIPSPSREESGVADILESELRALGFAPQRKGNNVWAEAWAHEENKPTILLDAHIDTVKPNLSWVRNPFEAVTEGDRLYGLGSNDDGGSVVALLTVFSRLAATTQPDNLMFLASAGEAVTSQPRSVRNLTRASLESAAGAVDAEVGAASWPFPRKSSAAMAARMAAAAISSLRLSTFVVMMNIPVPPVRFV